VVRVVPVTPPLTIAEYTEQIAAAGQEYAADRHQNGGSDSTNGAFLALARLHHRDVGELDQEVERAVERIVAISASRDGAFGSYGLASWEPTLFRSRRRQ
jgi:hypothetical protein